jgi:hypothetical protein
VSYNPQAPDTAGDRYQQQLNDLDIQAGQEQLANQKAMNALLQTQAGSQLAFWQTQTGLDLERQKQEQGFQLGYEQEAFKTAQAAQEVVTRSVEGKKKVECPVGMHLVVGADGIPQCQQKGGGGFNLSTVFGGIGQIAQGLFSGAAAAAPGIGYGAANAAATYGLGQAGLNPSMPKRANQGFTPPIAPQGAPYARQAPVPYNPQTNRGLTYL